MIALIVVALVAAVVAQPALLLLLLNKRDAAASEERRFLVNQALAKTPQEFAILAAAARPDETVEAVAEARQPRSSTPAPLGL